MWERVIGIILLKRRGINQAMIIEYICAVIVGYCLAWWVERFWFYGRKEYDEDC